MSEHAPIRVALVGCGVIGRTHAEVLTRLPGFELVLAIDAAAEAAAAIADLAETMDVHRPAAAADLAAALDGDTDFDLVAIATPSGLHARIALEALGAGKHVMIEKPLDVDTRRARVLAEAADEARELGVHGAVISQHRFDPSTLAVADAIRSGRLGRIGSAVMSVPWWRSDDYYASADWRGTWALDGGGALINQGVHTLDLLIAFLGRPLRVNAEFGRLAHDGIEVEDTLVGTVVFESGALATVHATTAAYPGSGARLQVHGSAGSIVIEGDELAGARLADLEAIDGITSADHAAALGRSTPVDDDALGGASSHARQYVDLLGAIHGRHEPAVTIADAALVLSTARAMYLSASLERRIDVGEVLSGALDSTSVQLPAGVRATR